MKRLARLAVSLVLFGSFGSLAQRACASTDTVHIDIHVSISASKSLQALTTYYDFGALPVSSTTVSASSITIRNDSGALVESYLLYAGDAISQGGGTNWTLAGSPSSDHYQLDAVFGSTQPALNDGNWTLGNLSYTPTNCSDDAHFGNNVSGESCYQISPLGSAKDRQLWFRMKTPTAVTSPNEHIAVVNISVQ